MSLAMLYVSGTIAENTTRPCSVALMLASVVDDGPALKTTLGYVHTQLARYTDPMLVKCWASVADDSPTLNQHWVSVSCLLGIMSTIKGVFKGVPFIYGNPLNMC